LQRTGQTGRRAGFVPTKFCIETTFFAKGFCIFFHIINPVTVAGEGESDAVRCLAEYLWARTGCQKDRNKQGKENPGETLHERLANKTLECRKLKAIQRMINDLAQRNKE
jgi:hypothetical protein